MEVVSEMGRIRRDCHIQAGSGFPPSTQTADSGASLLRTAGRGVFEAA